MPTNRPPSLPLSYSPTLAHPLIPLFYSLLFFSPLDALLFPSFLLPSLSLLFYSAITRLLFSLSFSLFSLILAYPPFLYCALPILFSFLLSLCRFSFSLLLSSTFGRLLSITPLPFFSSRLISSLPSASETKRRSLAAFLCLPPASPFLSLYRKATIFLRWCLTPPAPCLAPTCQSCYHPTASGI